MQVHTICLFYCKTEGDLPQAFELYSLSINNFLQNGRSDLIPRRGAEALDVD